MKKGFTRIVCLCLLLCLACPVIGVQAAGLNSLLTFHEVITEDTQSSLLLYGTVLPENGDLSVSIDSQSIPDPVLSTVRQEKLPVTVYCLVDISNHMTKEQVQQQQDILNIISSRMGDGDSMVITTVGSKTVEGTVLDSLEARKTAISTLKRDGTKADMYRAVIDAMTSLERKTDYCTNRCLLILSDGNVSSASGTTEQQALNAIKSTSIPVYAIGITGDFDSAYYVNNAGHMLKMAETSLGGLSVIPAQERISAADAAQRVWENIQKSAVIRVDLAAVTSRDNNASVRVQYVSDGILLEDSVSADLTGVVAGSTNPAATEAAEENAEILAPETNTSWIADNLLWIVIGVVCLAAVIAVCVLLAKKKKKLPQDVPAVEDILNTSDLPGAGGQDSEQPSHQDRITTVPVASDNSVTVQMVVTTHQNVSAAFELQPHKQQILGRDDRADIITNAEDYQLSGKHCAVEWDGSYLYVQDIGSTNGTTLNGISLKPGSWSRINSGSVLHMGSFDYLVSITR